MSDVAVALADLSLVCVRLGDLETAKQAVAEACVLDPGEGLAGILLIAAVVHHLCDMSDQAKSDLDNAITMLREVGDRERLGRALNNRGLLAWQLGRPREAIVDLDEADDLYEQLDRHAQRAKFRHNRGLVYIAAGRVPEGLRLLSEADAELSRLGVGRWTVLYDRCRVLIELGLAAEAVELGRATVRGLENAAGQLELADMFYALAGAALLTGELGHAGGNALSAISMFRKQGRTAQMNQAQALDDVLRILFEKEAAESIDPDNLALVDPGYLLVAAEYAFDFDRIDDARVFATAAVKSLTEAPRTAANELTLATAQAIISIADGQFEFATEAVHQGFHFAQRNAAVLGSVELRAAALSSADRLGTLGVMAGVEQNDLVEALLSTELARSLVPQMSTRAPAAEVALDAGLERLRRVEFAMRMNEDPARQIDLVHERVAAEQHVRELTWMADPSDVVIIDRFNVPDLRDHVNGRAIASFARVGSQLYAFAVPGGPGEVQLFRLGDAAEMRRIAENLRRAVGAIAEGKGGGLGRRRLDRSLNELHAQLSGMVELFGDDELIIVPDDGLEAMPWQLIPGFAGRVITLSTAASLWYPSEVDSYERVVAAVGPGVPHGRREARTIAKAYNKRKVLEGKNATVGAVTQALAGADVLHLCAHGHFRSDNALLSSVDLSNGQLSMYDLMLQPSLPPLIVTSACDVGLGALGGHGGLVGAAAALAGRGCERFVASVCTVRDDEASDLMVKFHERVARGSTAERALADAQSEMIDAGALTVAGFTVVAVP